MPLYEYRCQKCGLVFEVLQKVHEAPLERCPKCEGALKKVISPPAIQFKGSGWYITDYAPKKESEQEKKPKDEPKSEKKGATQKKKE